jgi:predicted dinucleotide-binding enzyme
MNDQNFTTGFTVDRTPEEVFAAINNVRGWWTGEIEGSTDKPGAEFTYRYKDFHYSKQKITELIPGKKVVWRVVEASLNFVEDRTEWNGSEITFHISKQGDKTEVRFTHVGLVPEHECYNACSNAWGSYINGSLRSLITTGKGEPNQMRIGIIGAGNIGGTLARHFTRLGHLVSIANSRGPESLTGLADEIGAKAVSVTEAAKAGGIVIIAIPTKAVVDLPQGLFSNASPDGIVVDTGNYHPELRDGRIEAIDRGMPDSRWVAQQIGRPVIKAFNTIFAKSLLEKGTPKGTPGRIALSVFGDSVDGKAAVLGLIDDLGFDPVDGGDLVDSWRQQTGTPAYCKDLEAAALRQALAEAVHERVAEYRAAEEARIRKYLAAQNGQGQEE